MRKSAGHLSLSAITFGAVLCFTAVGTLSALGRGDSINAAPSQTELAAFVTDLTSSGVVPPSISSASGRAVFVISDTLDYRVVVTATGTISHAALYAGAPSTNGVLIATLFDVGTATADFDEDNPLVGSTNLSALDEVVLRAQGAYLQIDSDEYPAGEIRGQALNEALPYRLQATLTGADEVPPVVTSATGSFSATINPSGDEIEVLLEVADLADPTMAHIHRGLPGVNGPPTLWLYDAAGVNAPGGALDETRPVSGTLQLSPALLADIMAHLAYVNVHTVAHSGGEIRGQILITDQPGPTATPSSTTGPSVTPTDETATPSETPDDTSTPTGTSVDPSETPTGTTETPTSETPTATETSDGTPPTPTGTATGATATATETTPPTVTPTASATLMPPPPAFFSDLVPTTPLTSTGTIGWMYAVLDPDTTTLHYRIGVTTTATITAARLLDGEDGPVVAWLYDATGAEAPGGPFDADSPLRASVVLSSTTAALLRANGTYLSVSTDAQPEGEVGGDVLGFVPSTYSARMTGAEEVPPINSNATGTARFTVVGNQRVDYVMSVRDINGIILAHLHLGRRGVGGPPVVTLYSASGVGGPSGPFDPDNDFSGSAAINPETLADLISGWLYVNVHSVAYPGGEIRGQVVPGTIPSEFEASLPFVEGVSGSDALTDFGTVGPMSCMLSSPAAISGRGETGIQIQNLSPSIEASSVTEFRSGDGTLRLSLPYQIDPLAAINIFLPGQPLPAGYYGGRVRSDQPVGAIVRTDWNDTGGAAIYSDVAPSRNAALPLAVRHYRGQTSRISIQNTADEAATVTVTVNEVGEATPALTMTLTIAPLGMQMVDLETREVLGEQFLGALSARSSSPIAIQSFVDIATSDQAVYGFEAMPVERAAQRLYAPLFRAKQFPRGGDPSSGRLDTGISVFNPNAVEASVALTYHGSRDRAAAVGCRGLTFTSPTVVLEPNSSHVFYQGDPASQGLPEDCFGSAVINADQPVLAIVNDSLNEGDSAAAYNAVAAGANRVALPLYRREHAGGLSTGIQAMNLGAVAARVQIRFMRQDPDGSTHEVLGCGEWCDVMIEPGEAHTWWPPNQPVLAPNTYGAAFIESTQPVAVIVNDVVVTGERDMATYNGIGVE